MRSIKGQRLLQSLDSHSDDVVKGSLLLPQLHLLHVIHKHTILALIPVLPLSLDFKEDFDHSELDINIYI